MSRNIKKMEGGGPWLLRPADEGIDPLPAGESVRFDLERMTFNGRERYFYDWLPIDEVLIKNLDDSAAVTTTYNHRYGSYTEPKAADSFSETGVRHIEVRNEGTTDIPSANLTVQLKVNPYDADEAALDRRQQPPIERMVRAKLGL